MGNSFGGPVSGPVGGPGTPTGPAQKRSKRSSFKLGLFYAGGFLAVIWIVHIINYGIFFGGLSNFGIYPLDTSTVWHVFTAPLLHADLEHILSNSVPGALFAFLIGYSGHRVFWEVTTLAMAVAGAGTWLFGGVGTNHIGASGIIYGWLGYLLIRGIFNRSPQQISLGILLGFMYSGLIWGVLPTTPGVSWQGHLFGAIGGLLAGTFITSDDPPELAASKIAKKESKMQAKQR
ncbi:rhomboid family intramembrane serine protease [Corynebacterium aquatimens]